MPGTHTYDISIEWTGDLGTGTDSYRTFSRSHDVLASGKEPIAGSADSAFRGDAGRWNPEELLIASVAQCHMLSYLHLCSAKGVAVVDYEDHASGVMTMDTRGGGGQISAVTLRPEVVVARPELCDRAARLHDDVGAVCFIARSVNFPIHHQPRVTARG